jgi:hypothetical protein
MIPPLGEGGTQRQDRSYCVTFLFNFQVLLILSIVHLAIFLGKDKMETSQGTEMRVLLIIYLLLPTVLIGCNGWTVQPVSVNSPPPHLPSQTPSILTATPIFLSTKITVPAVESSLTPTQLSSIVTPVITLTPTETPASQTLVPTLVTFPPELLKVDILGCNTSLDITHGMGEVTNAFMTISNPGTTDLENICATLRGQDEGRLHPDKTKCISSLPAGFQDTLKLTIDTTYKESSPIQVDINSRDVLLQRLGKDSCTNIGLFPPDDDDLGHLKRIP